MYCFYDPDFRALALGKLTALKETEFVREVGTTAALPQHVRNTLLSILALTHVILGWFSFSIFSPYPSTRVFCSTVVSFFFVFFFVFSPCGKLVAVVARCYTHRLHTPVCFFCSRSSVHLLFRAKATFYFSPRQNKWGSFCAGRSWFYDRGFTTTDRHSYTCAIPQIHQVNQRTVVHKLATVTNSLPRESLATTDCTISCSSLKAPSTRPFP